MKETLSYSDKVHGWTSFHSWHPEWMAKLNNRFFTVKNGQLWLHNDETNPVRNNFYGQQFNSKVITVFNEFPTDDKIFKTLNLEGTHPWNTIIRTNYTESTISKDEYNKRESRWFAYTRKNEDTNDLTGHTGQGIGVITAHAGLTVTFAFMPNLVSVNDVLYQLNGANEQIIGTITAINGNVVTVNAVTTVPINGLFAFAKKNPRIEGGEMRGYYLEVELENTETEPVELFALNSNIVKSHL